MTLSVLVVGDANVDLVLRGDVNPRFGQTEQLLHDAQLVLGSSAGIAACGLASLGVRTALVAKIGDDEFGRFTVAALTAAGVRTSEVTVVEGAPTGISVILSRDDDRAILTHPGAIALLTAADVRAAVAETVPQHVHFASYFLLPQLARELPELLQWLRARDITSSIDTNWDPSAVWAGIDAVIEHVDVLLPNLMELRAISAALGIDAQSDEAAALAIAQRGPSVVVKAGAAGGWSVDASGDVASAPGLVVDVVDTTGAGDSFDAGYLAALAYGVEQEATRLRWAVTAGSLSTRSAGGTAAQPTMDELQESLGA